MSRAYNSLAANIGCVCDTTTPIVATFRHTQLMSITIEHSAYCPIGTIYLDPIAYAETGQRIELGQDAFRFTPKGTGQLTTANSDWIWQQPAS